jgi:hypothetical protein
MQNIESVFNYGIVHFKADILFLLIVQPFDFFGAFPFKLFGLWMPFFKVIGTVPKFRGKIDHVKVAKIEQVVLVGMTKIINEVFDKPSIAIDNIVIRMVFTDVVNIVGNILVNPEYV